MSLTSPWMLLFGLAAMVPVWLHVRRRAALEISFPSISIIQKVARKRKKPLRIRELLLLALRILALATIALAAARPGVTVQRPGGLRAGAPIALAIVLDNSMSMQLITEDEQTVFDRARTIALNELERLRPGDAAALIFSGRSSIPSDSTVTYDINKIKRLIQAATPTHFAGDLPKATRIAAQILEKSPLQKKEILVITDLAEDPIWGNLDAPQKNREIALTVRSARDGGMPANSAVDRILVSHSPEGVAREVLIEARVSNFSDTPLEGLPIVLEVESSEVSRGTIDVPPRGSAVKQFYHRFHQEGVYRGSVRIRKDQLPADDTRHFATAIRESIRVLVVDGDYQPGSYRDEAFYLYRALETPMQGEVPIKTILVDLATALQSTLTENEVVFLAGVPRIPPHFANRLVQYVEQGGGLFVTSSAKGNDFEALQAIMPASVHSVRQAQKKGKNFRIAAINRAHPIFQPFASLPTGLEKTHIDSFVLAKPSPSSLRRTLIELVRGFPLLLERKAGDGTVMLLTTTIDRDWTDLPIRPGFLPMVQRATRHLAGRLDDRGPRRAQAGRPIPLEVSEGMQRLVVRKPDGRDTNYAARELVDRSTVVFSDTSIPGHYFVWAETPGFGGLRQLPHQGFVVETDPGESDLSKNADPKNQEPSPGTEMISSTLPVWPHLLIVAMLLLFAETWLAGRGLRRSHRGKSSSSP